MSNFEGGKKMNELPLLEKFNDTYNKRHSIGDILCRIVRTYLRPFIYLIRSKYKVLDKVYIESSYEVRR